MSTFSRFFNPSCQSNVTKSEQSVDSESECDVQCDAFIKPSIKSNQNKLACINDPTYMNKVYQRLDADLFLPCKLDDEWKHIIIAGGYVIDLLMETNKSTDIDIFIINCTTDQVKKIATRIQQQLDKPANKIIRESKSVITLQGKTKNIQIINGSTYTTGQDVINQFDINCCKVMFNGYQFYYTPEAALELTDGIIRYSHTKNHAGSESRIYRYIVEKGFGLDVNQSDMEKVYPLYLFTQTHNLEQILRSYQLNKNKNLIELHDKMTILKPKHSSNDDGYTAMMKSKSPTLLKNKGLSSCISKIRGKVDQEVNDMVDESYNLFGLPELLYKIKTGADIDIDVLRQSQSKDHLGFHVTCYLIFYHPSDDYIINFMSDSHLLESKNMNYLNLSYIELACLLNRQKLVKFLMTRETYKTVMKIAVITDNLELYNLAYKTKNSEDRYLYTRETLIKFRAASILNNLYSESMPDSDTDDMTSDQDDSLKTQTIELLDNCKTAEDFIINYTELNKYKSLATLVTDRIPMLNVKDSSKFAKFPAVYNQVRDLALANSNIGRDDRYTVFGTLMGLKQQTINVDDLSNIDQLRDLILLDHSIRSDYDFSSLYTNLLLIHLDNSDVFKQITDTKVVYEFLNDNISNLGRNLAKYREFILSELDIYRKYQTVFANTEQHIMAYSSDTLEDNFQRIENRIGLTPDDIILWKCFKVYIDTLGDQDCTMSDELRKSILCRQKSLDQPILPIAPLVESDQLLIQSEFAALFRY